MKELFAYCDESGNSGLNLFDKNQPEFWTAVMYSTNDVDRMAENEIIALTEKLSVNELHGSELGLGKIETISKDLIELYTKHDCYFVFSRIEKRLISPLKFFDYLFDNANNKAVHGVHYGFNQLRLPLALSIIEAFSPDMEVDFWNAYKKLDFLKIRKIIEKLAFNIRKGERDKRKKELILDACEWAKVNVDKVFDTQMSKVDSPNMIALSQLIISTNRKFGNEIKVVKFTHDEQNQFMKEIPKIYSTIKNVHPKKDAASFIEFDLVETFDCPLQFNNSTDSKGLQLVDISLWLIKKAIAESKEFHGGCYDLLEFISSSSHYTNITKEGIREEIQHGFQKIMSKDLSDEQLTEGMVLYDEFESSRKDRKLASSNNVTE